MEIKDLQKHMFVGVDIHKGFHVATLTNCWGQKIEGIRLINDFEGFTKLEGATLRLAKNHDLVPIFVLEDSNGHGKFLAKYLLRRGHIVKEINPVLTSDKRKRANHRVKTDESDALNINKISITEFSRLKLLEPKKDIKEGLSILVRYYGNMVQEQTRIKNRLHNLLFQEYPFYLEMFKNPFSKTAISFWQRFPSLERLKIASVEEISLLIKNSSHNRLGRESLENILNLRGKEIEMEGEILKAVRLRVIKELLEQLEYHQERIKRNTKELELLVKQAGGEYLLSLDGVDYITAAKLMAFVEDIGKFKNASKLARYAGIAPVEKSSGKRNRHVRDVHGNRKLNEVFYGIALTQLRENTIAKNYYEKKIGEGKSKKEAMICLMRRLVDIVYAMMKNQSVYDKDKTQAGKT